MLWLHMSNPTIIKLNVENRTDKYIGKDSSYRGCYGLPIKTVLPEFSKEKCKYEILDGSSKEKILFRMHSSFVTAAMFSFSQHVNLSISPDSVWIQILAQHNAMLVESKDKSDLTVILPVGLPYRDMASYVLGAAKSIGSSINDYVCDFSTTGINERIASQMIAISVLSKTANIKMMTACGIPEVHMQGTIKDWEKVKVMSKELIDADWYEKMLPLLDGLIEASGGVVNHKFWDSFVNEKSRSGSGPMFNGIIKSLFPRTKEENGFMKLDTIPITAAYTEVPWDNIGEEVTVVFMGGSLGTEIRNNAVATKEEWIIAQKITG